MPGAVLDWHPFCWLVSDEKPLKTDALVAIAIRLWAPVCFPDHGMGTVYRWKGQAEPACPFLIGNSMTFVVLSPALR